MLLSRWANRLTFCSASALTETISKTSVFLLVLIVVLQYLFVGRHDPHRCSSLLSSGSWPPARLSGDERHEFDRWEPSGCLMHEYPWDDFRGCLGSDSKRVVFVGDSTVRQMFWAAAQRLDSVRAEVERMDQFVSENPQRDIELSLDGVDLVFVWDPWLNSTGLAEELARFNPEPATGKEVGRPSAALLVLGAPGLWAARNGGSDYFELFQRGVDYVRPYLRHDLGPETGGPKEIGWPDMKNQVVLTPVQVPRYFKLSSARAEALSPDKIRRMNDYIAQLSQSERVHVVGAYNEMTVRVRRAFEDTGLHVREAVADRKLDLVLNLRCNAGLASRGGHAARTTCCTAYADPVRVQRALLVVGLGVLPVLLWVRRANIRRLGRRVPHLRYLRSALALFSVLLYCYLADRSHLFAKAEKRPSELSASSLLVITSVIGFLSVRRSESRTGDSPLTPTAKWTEDGATTACDDSQKAVDPGFLPHKISDEWKGLMQFLLLVFHFQDSTGLLWTYKLTRLFAASYLFLSTYGHARYFLRMEDYSLRRVAAVVWRLNFLPFVVSLMVRTDGNLYYFPRLATFWFFVVYAAVRLGGRRLNGSPALLLGKLAVVAMLTTSLINSPASFDTLGRYLSFCGPVVYSADEARSMLAGDRFVPFLGMVAAVLGHRASVLKHENDRLTASSSPPPIAASAPAVTAHGFPPAITAARPWLRPPARSRPVAKVSASNAIDSFLLTLMYPDQNSEALGPILLMAAGVGLLVFFFQTQSLHRFVDRDSYDAYHPYISLVPIPAFAALRNCAPVLRRHHLALPALLGPLALEAYVLRNHIWLAADGTALLRLGFWPRRDDGGRWEPPGPLASWAGSPPPSWFSLAGWRLETILMTVVFFFACWHAKRATNRLAEWAFGGGEACADGQHLPSYFIHRGKRIESDDNDLESVASPTDGPAGAIRVHELCVLGGSGSSQMAAPSRSGHRCRHSSSSGGEGGGWLQDPRVRCLGVILFAWLSNVYYK